MLVPTFSAMIEAMVPMIRPTFSPKIAVEATMISLLNIIAAKAFAIVPTTMAIVPAKPKAAPTDAAVPSKPAPAPAPAP